MKKVAKHIIATLVAFSMILSIMPIVFAVETLGEDHASPQVSFDGVGSRTALPASDWISFQSAVAIANNTNYVELTADIHMLDAIAIAPGTDVLIVSEGGEWTIFSAPDSRHFTVTGSVEDTILSFDGTTTLHGGENSGGIAGSGDLYPGNQPHDFYLNNAIITGCLFDDTVTHSESSAIFLNFWRNIHITGGAFCGNTSSASGAGMYFAENDHEILTDVMICHNTATVGGGIYKYAMPSRFGGIGITITNCVISENTAVTYGGGFCLQMYGTNVTITNTDITENTAGVAGGGGHVFMMFNEARFENCNIDGNSAPNGGGLSLGGGSEGRLTAGDVFVINCRITNNEAFESPFIALWTTEDFFLDNPEIAVLTDMLIGETSCSFDDVLMYIGIYIVGVPLIELDVDGVPHIGFSTGGYGGGIYLQYNLADHLEAAEMSQSGRLGYFYEMAEVPEEVIGMELGGELFWWTPHEVLFVDRDTVFEGNQAQNEYYWDLELSAYYHELHDEKVLSQSFSMPYENAYNNADICFEMVQMYTIEYIDDTDTLTMVSAPALTSPTLLQGPIRPGKTFLGWKVNDILYQPGHILTSIQDDVTLYAMWEEDNPGGNTSGGGGGAVNYTVTFDSDGGSDVPYQKVARDGKAAKPANPTKPGYIFKGWHTKDGEEFDFNSNITDNTKLTAHWEEAENAALKVICIDENGREIYISVANENIGDTITVDALKLIGYVLDDDASKSITILDDENILTFKYAVRTAANEQEGLILDLVNHIKYLNGYPEGDVKPDNGITRAEAAAIFFRLLTNSNKYDPVSNPFPDVDASAWYGQSVLYLAENGIIVGYKDGTFRPNEQITRAEFAAMASRFDDLEEVHTGTFRDVTDEHWALSFVSSANTKGWITGFPDGTFKPEDQITRAQVVTIVNRMLMRKIELADIPVSVVEYIDLTAAHWAYSDIIEASTLHNYKRKDTRSIHEIWIEFDNGSVIY